jgi:hypothetical protein
MAEQNKIRTLADAIIVGAVAVPGAFVPGPWHAPISKALAPKKGSAVAARSAGTSYAGWALSMGTAVALKGKKGMGQYISRQGKALALLKAKRYKSGLKAIAKAQKPFFAAGIMGTSGGATYGHYTGVQKQAMFTKLGFHPASFARRTSPQENLAFVERFQQTPSSAKTTGVATSPLVIGLGAISYLFGRDKKSKDEAGNDRTRSRSGFLPKFTMFLTALVATKKWREATKKDKKRFAREYNASMGTRYQPDHPKMKTLWELMRQGSGRPTSLIKYAAKRKRSSIGDHMAYLKYISSHKFNVLKAGREIGVPTTTLLAHDMSKFKPTEWKPYVDYWFGPEGKTGTHNPAVKQRFRDAAEKHYRRNPHHYHKIQKHQPMKNQLEAIADWYSVNRTMHYRVSNTKFPTINQWFENKKDTLTVSDELRDYMSNRT